MINMLYIRSLILISCFRLHAGFEFESLFNVKSNEDTSRSKKTSAKNVKQEIISEDEKRDVGKRPGDKWSRRT